MHETREVRPFSGGLTLRPFKALSTSTPIVRLAMPPRLVIAMAQHAGQAARPIVAPHQHVRRGEIIGEPVGTMSAAVHASGAGIVESIETRLVPSGTSLIESQCVVIATDIRQELEPTIASAPAWPHDAEGRLAAARDAGIVGLGGAAFPTAIKLGAARACHTLILNGAECEPYISCDDMLMRAHAGEVLHGAQLMLELLGAEHCIVAVERDKDSALTAIRDAIQLLDDDRLELAALPTVYPAGGERQLVESLLGKEVPSGGHPIDIGIVCQNVATACALAALAERGRPLISRIVTVTGHGLRHPKNIEAPIGASIGALIECCGGLTDDAAQLILGGNMMGYALPTDDIPVTKSTNCILALTAAEIGVPVDERPCIRCGDCASACPARLLPQELLRAVHRNGLAGLSELGLSDCIECGCCDVVCPSHIPLTSTLREAKQRLASYLEHQRRAAIADQRFDRHLAREADRAEQARQAQQRLKAPLATDAPSRQAAIEAAIRRARERRRNSDEQG